MKESFIYKKIITLILILSFVAPIAFLTVPKKVNAFVAADIIGGPSNVINVGFSMLSAGFDAVSSAAQTSLAFKEYVLDPLTVLLREVLIQSITASIVNWINSGFEGEPAFITDLQGFMLDVGDQVVGRYIQGSELAGLCSPFQLNVRIALALDYYSSDNVSCTLTGVLGNIDNAFGDFSSGNAWDSWYQLSINPNNNAYGSFLSSRQALQQDISNAQSLESQKLNWGNGFKSFEVCDKNTKSAKPWVNPDGPQKPKAKPWINPDGPQNPSGGGRNVANISAEKSGCKISTPGVIINEQLSKTLGSGFKQLELADEINEIIGALLGQLVKQVLGGSNGGFSGLSRSSYNRPSYTDQLLNGSRSSSTIRGKSLEAIRTSLQSENKYRDAKQTSLDAVRVARGKVEILQQCYLEKVSQKQTLWGVIGVGSDKKIVSFTTTELTSNANNASSTITNTLLPLQNKLTKDIGSVDNVIGQLVAIRTDMENAQSVEDLNNVVNRYQTLRQNGQLKTIKDIYDAELERDGYPGEKHNLAKGIVRDMTKLNNQTDTDLNICQSLIFTYEPSLI